MTATMTFDPEVDAIYVYFRSRIMRGEVERSEFLAFANVAGGMTIDWDKSGHLVGLEILGASEYFDTDVLAAAAKSAPPDTSPA